MQQDGECRVFAVENIDVFRVYTMTKILPYFNCAIDFVVEFWEGVVTLTMLTPANAGIHVVELDSTLCDS